MSISTATESAITWFWEWVPTPVTSEPDRTRWSEHLVELIDDWAGENLEAVRSAWPADTPGDFPFTPANVGGAIAASLLERAAELPHWGRLAWGAAFVSGQLRWAPVPVVVEFHTPQADDPGYLMHAVGAEGADGDAREPTVDYVTTAAGDGLRVFAIARTESGPLYGRLDAALRIETPPTPADVLLSTRVSDLAQMAVIGPGVELLMNLIADEWIADRAAESEDHPAGAVTGGEPR